MSSNRSSFSFSITFRSRLFENLRMLPHAPGVQMQGNYLPGHCSHLTRYLVAVLLFIALLGVVLWLWVGSGTPLTLYIDMFELFSEMIVLCYLQPFLKMQSRMRVMMKTGRTLTNASPVSNERIILLPTLFICIHWQASIFAVVKSVFPDRRGSLLFAHSCQICVPWQWQAWFLCSSQKWFGVVMSQHIS